MSVYLPPLLLQLNYPSNMSEFFSSVNTTSMKNHCPVSIKIYLLQHFFLIEKVEDMNKLILC
jgi:hypothetical protein